MKAFLHHIIWLLRGVIVYALVGESGSGKSFRARLIADKYGIDLIIDDGLLIKDDSIIAGKSAKKEKAFLAAVKTALFDESGHRHEVVSALEKENFKRILVIGTSDGMIKKIVKRLNLPAPRKFIRIEEVASTEDIELAKRTRSTEGKHVIPVPAIEIKRDYPQIFYDSIKIFLRNRLAVKNKNRVFEKAVVRPEFSRRGKISISETAISQMVLHCVDEYNPEIKVEKISVKVDHQGYILSLTVQLPYGVQLAGSIHHLRDYVLDNIEKYAGINIKEVNINIERFTVTPG